MSQFPSANPAFDLTAYSWVPERFHYLINDPAARLQLREDFYKRFGEKPGKSLCKRIIRWITRNEGYGASELKFMQWEIGRNVLNPIHLPANFGSKWWRNMNLLLLINAQIAAEIKQGIKAPDQERNNEVDLWLQYIDTPSPIVWYRAHNASIIKGYLNFTHYAKEESVYEQKFMNEVLYRLLYAQAMLEDDTIFKKDGVFMANPLLPAVDLMVHIPAFYPDHYPLTPQDIQDVIHKGHGLQGEIEKLFDEFLIKPHIVPLFHSAAQWNNTPQLTEFLVNGNPVYPHHQSQ